MIKLFLNSPSNKGWTLIEMAAVAIVTGILAALAMPSMMGMKARQDLTANLGRVKGNIQEAQRAAMRKGQSCTVNLTSSGISGSPSGCISDPYTATNGVSLTNSASSFNFSYKGTTPNEITIILASTNTSDQKCVIISAGLGILRSGNYNGTNCVSSF